MVNNKRSFRKEIITTVAAVAMIVCTGVLFTRVNILDTQIDEIHQQIQERQKAEDELLKGLKEIKTNQEELKKLEQERIEREKAHTEAVTTAKTMLISTNTDIRQKTDLTGKDMDKIIAQWDKHTKNGTNFTGKGDAFIQASRETGIHPIYILAIACLESAYGTSYIANTKHNYYGINAVDSNPTEGSSVMGSNTSEGIINGAIWIKENFVDNGYTTLGDMNAACYSTNDEWSSQVVSIAQSSQEFL